MFQLRDVLATGGRNTQHREQLIIVERAGTVALTAGCEKEPLPIPGREEFGVPGKLAYPVKTRRVDPLKNILALTVRRQAPVFDDEALNLFKPSDHALFAGAKVPGLLRVQLDAQRLE